MLLGISSLNKYLMMYHVKYEDGRELTSFSKRDGLGSCLCNFWVNTMQDLIYYDLLVEWICRISVAPINSTQTFCVPFAWDCSNLFTPSSYCWFQGVTLGGSGKEIGDRHPKIGQGALIGPSATILGNIRIGDGAMIAAGSLVLKDIPPHR